MTKSGMNLQDSFLNQVRKENTEIMLMLLDGTRLVGYVRGFDNFTVIMNVRGSQHLIYKHAIAQIVSRRITQHGEGERENAQGAAPAPEADQGAGAEAAPAEGGQAPAPHGGHEGGFREGRSREGRHREGGFREGGPRQDRGEGREGREGAPRRERERDSHEEGSGKPKFNTIDFSSIKIEEHKTK